MVECEMYLFLWVFSEYPNVDRYCFYGWRGPSRLCNFFPLHPWVTSTYHSPLIHKVTSLFLNTNWNKALRTNKTIYNQLRDKILLNKIKSSGIHRLKCKTCNKSYFGQTGKSTEIRHREHKRYMKTNNPFQQKHCTFQTKNMNKEMQNKQCN